MYRKDSEGWLKHGDFIVLDMICLQLAFILAYAFRGYGFNVYGDILYRNMAIFLGFADLVVIFTSGTMKSVLKRGHYKEFVSTLKNAVIVGALAIAYLFIIQEGQSFSRMILITTIVIAQYFFGIVNRLLLTADQRGYIQYNAQTLAVICNTVACFVLIQLGCSIQIVKLTTSLIYLLQPFVIYLYVRQHYSIDKKIKYTKEPIPQKWNGIAQHVAAVILDGTDTIVLTLFATLSDVSIYSVYFLVVKGVKNETEVLSASGELAGSGV